MPKKFCEKCGSQLYQLETGLDCPNCLIIYSVTLIKYTRKYNKPFFEFNEKEKNNFWRQVKKLEKKELLKNQKKGERRW